MTQNDLVLKRIEIIETAQKLRSLEAELVQIELDIEKNNLKAQLQAN